MARVRGATGAARSLGIGSEVVEPDVDRHRAARRRRCSASTAATNAFAWIRTSSPRPRPAARTRERAARRCRRRRPARGARRGTRPSRLSKARTSSPPSRCMRVEHALARGEQLLRGGAGTRASRSIMRTRVRALARPVGLAASIDSLHRDRDIRERYRRARATAQGRALTFALPIAKGRVVVRGAAGEDSGADGGDAGDAVACCSRSPSAALVVDPARPARRSSTTKDATPRSRARCSCAATRHARAWTRRSS